MSTEGFAEEMLALAFDYMIQEEKVGRAFMAKAPRLRKLWLENYFTKKDRKSTRLNSSHLRTSRMPSSA